MADTQARIAGALVNFASKREFPDDESVAAATVQDSVLPAAYQALDAAKNDLEAEIRDISREAAPDVTDWMRQARALQADIEKSRRLAGEIVKQAEADEERIRALEDQEAHLAFLEKEQLFNSQLHEALRSIKRVHQLHDEAERLAIERHILEALQVLAGTQESGSSSVSLTAIDAWQALASIPGNKSTRVLTLLERRATELKTSIHEQFLHIWGALIYFDPDNGKLTINQTIEGEFMSLDQAVIVLQSYKEVEKMAEKFWKDLDVTVLGPRTDLFNPIQRLTFENNSIGIDGAQGDTNIKSLLRDLEGVFDTLTNNLPSTFIPFLAEAMMPELSKRISEDWLDRSVPSSLKDMVDFQKTLLHVDDFINKLTALGWSGLGPLKDWVSDAPRIWLGKRRERALDWIRNQLSLGVGDPIPAQHIESRMVNKEEGLHITSTGDVITEDWESGWRDEEAEELPTLPQQNRASSEEARMYSTIIPGPNSTVDDDDATAWGWGDDDDANDPDADADAEDSSKSVVPEKRNQSLSPETREVTLSESYYTSSMPKPVYDMILNIYSDGAQLTSKENEDCPLAIAATGLFSLPTLILAMYRAVSPFHYSRDPSGNMFIYNDSMWLCDRFKEYSTEWGNRPDLTPRAYGKVKLDPEIKALQSFGKRAYTNEMIAQRTIISDLMGGAQNSLQGILNDDVAQGIQPVVSYIREKASMWKKILPYSVWASAVGSLVNAVASKIIADVFDLPGMDVDEAEQTAQLITTVSGLDDLFIRDSSSTNGDTPIPLTAQFASNWMKMKFLSEVLQANLADIRYLWFESDLSLYFTKEETADLIRLSFEDNPNSRQLIREIKQSMVSRGGD